MSQESVTDRLTHLRQKYLEHPPQQEGSVFDSPKGEKLKKKLMTLEKERCQRKMANRDCQAIEEKMAALKQAFHHQ